MRIEMIADNLNLHRSGNYWRGECPACHYGVPTLLLKEKQGRLSFGCVSCDDRDTIRAAVEAAGGGQKVAKADSTAAEKAAEGRRKQQERAQAFWSGSEPLSGDDPASVYLRRRRIDSAIGNPALRFRPDMPHPSNRKLPALVCRIDGPDGGMLAIQRIYLDADGRKADIEPAKAVKGPFWTGAIRFGTGPEIVVAEGPETALAAGVLLGFPAWSAVSCGNLARGLMLPTEIRRIVIAADHDRINPKTGKRPGIEAAEGAARRWRAEGRAVRIIKPHTEGDDFADVLMRRAEGA